MHEQTVFTVGHGVRPIAELVETLREAGCETLVDIRRYPFSRRNPQFGQSSLCAAVEGAGLTYRHAVDLGGLLQGEPGEKRFTCVRSAAFRSYAARMGTVEWQGALEHELAQPAPCFMCAETDWRRCHRRLLCDLLAARGRGVIHLLGPRRQESHGLYHECETLGGKLYLCGSLVA